MNGICGGFLDDFEEITVVFFLPLYLKYRLLDCNPIMQRCFLFLMHRIIARAVCFKHGGGAKRSFSEFSFH